MNKGIVYYSSYQTTIVIVTEITTQGTKTETNQYKNIDYMIRHREAGYAMAGL
jgi:hypothetical protein